VYGGRKEGRKEGENEKGCVRWRLLAILRRSWVTWGVGSWKEISSSLCGFLPTLLFWGVKFGTNAKKKGCIFPFFGGKKSSQKKKFPHFLTQISKIEYFSNIPKHSSFTLHKKLFSLRKIISENCQHF